MKRIRMIILLELLMAASVLVTPIMNRGGGHKCEEDRVVRTRENVTRMVNVTDTVHELCLDLSEGFRCTRQLTHFVPRLRVETREHVETVTTCCPGYISDNNDGCVKIRVVEEEGSGAAVKDADLPDESETSNLMTGEENVINDLFSPFFTQPVKGDRCGPKCCQCPPPFNVVDLGEKNDQCFCFHRPDEASESLVDHYLEREQMEMETANFTIDETTVENFKCAAFKWGKDCSLICHCNYDGAYGCDRDSGQCICNSYWSGEKCHKNENILMFVVLSISLLLLTLMIIGVVSITILRRTYYDLERRRKMIETKKARSMVSSIKMEIDPKVLCPDKGLFNNPTYGVLNIGYEENNKKAINNTLKKLDALQLSTNLKETEDKNSEIEEYDHLDYNRSIYINDLSENYCSGTPAMGIHQMQMSMPNMPPESSQEPLTGSLFGEVCSGTHV